MSGWFKRNKKTIEIDLSLVIGIAVLVAAIGAFVLIGGNANDGSPTSAFRRPVMPGHGLVMPTDVHPTNRPGTLMVAMGDYWFKPGTHRVRAGRYRFVSHNYGSIGHDIMLARAPIKMESANQPADDGVGLDGMKPGMTRSLKVTLTPGRWEFFCSLPGHYASGQHAILDVVGPMPKGMGTTHAPAMGGGMGTGA